MKKYKNILFDIYRKCPIRWCVFSLYYFIQSMIPYIYSFVLAFLLDKLVLQEWWKSGILIIILISIVFGVNITIYKWGPLLYDYVTFKLRKKYQKEFFAKLAKFDALYFQNQKNLEKNSFAEKAIGYDFYNYGASVILFIISIASLIMSSIALLCYSYIILLITFSVSFVLFFLKKTIKRKEMQFDDSMKGIEIKLRYYKRIYEDKRVLFESKIYGLFNNFSEKIIILETEMQKRTNRFVKEQNLLWILYYVIKFGINIFISFIIIKMVKESSSPSIGTFYFGLGVFNNFIDDFEQRLNDIISLKISKKYICDYYDIINKKDNTRQTTIMANKNNLISTSDLNFTYDEKYRFLLHDINIDIPCNKIISILGDNGSGKSTLINLLIKTYDNDLCKYSKDIFCERQIGVVFQDYHKYSFKLRDTISLGDISHKYDDDDIIETLKYVDGENILSKVKLDDYLGDSYNLGGKNISEGEWQKINLCKAFLKKERSLYVFDEPTCSLDPKSEYNLYKNIKKYTDNKTTILISHRIGFASLADYIYVLDSGRIIEQGTHIELMSKNGKYANMFLEQIKYYDDTILQGDVK